MVAIVAWLLIPGSASQDSPRLDRLKSLPYLSWSGEEVQESDRGGVVEFDTDRAFPGANILPFQHRPGGKLLDMKGREIVTFTDRRSKPTKWKLIEPLNEDRFLILAEGIMLIDRNSEILWQVDTNYHHDIDFDAEGRIYALSRRPEYRPQLNRFKKIMDDYLVVLEKSGEVVREFSFADIVLADPELAERAHEHHGAFFDLHEDLFHGNTVEIIPEDVYIKGEQVFQRGHVLVCWRNLDLVGALDPESGTLAWHWGFDQLDAPHQPTLLENGNLLIFDNGRDRGYSRVIELNPLTEEIVWEFRTEPPQAFYTASRGGAQRLPNGNTLITNSDSGEVIEITAEHEVVWRFLHPEIERRGLRRKLRRPAIYRMTRFDPALDRVNPFEPGVATTPRRLTTDPAEDRSPAWAPDGSRLLFASERDGSFDIYSIGSDGSDLERLTESPASDRSPAWAPSGDRFVFESDRGGANGLWIMDLETRESALLFEDSSPELVPDWSPDGRWIAFVSERDGNPELYRIEVDSGGVERLTQETYRDLWPRYSADGASLIFFSRRATMGSFDDLYRLDLDNREVTRLTEHPSHHDFVPDVSPADGRLVAGMSDREAGRRELVVFDPDGNVERRLASGYHRVFHPAWSPDGSTVAYAARAVEGESADLYLATVAAPTDAQ